MARLRASLRDQAMRKARVCYDHLADALGAAVLDHALAQRWRKRENDSRVVSFSRAGELAIRGMFALTNGV